ncbi:MAG: OmpH family outer membrane protein [Alphaproteobacteria bacterium]|mgnify:CR=1 FL=1|jgi:Skp family chaperone for outer membrane proteins|nr:OmpH family outer membrane protein [Alphaproteobacteria bacterium]MDP7222728.1 OmpH family outer membrane protein [Alphaproteobacteria bacterium]
MFKQFFLSFVVMSFVMVGISSHAMAETKIAVIDVQNLLNNSTAAENVQKQIAKKREEFQKEFATYESDLRKSQEELTKNATDKSKEDIQRERGEFEKKILETRKLVQERQISLEKAANKSLQTLRGEIFKIVADIAEEDGFTLVMSRQNVVLAEKSIDITERVMKRLNKSVKKIELEIE